MMVEKTKRISECCVDGGFLQSKHWADFNRRSGKAVFEFGQENKSRALAIEHKLPVVGKYWFIPRGPLANNEKELRIIIRIIIRNTLKQGIGWLRVEPQGDDDLKIIKKVLEAKYRIVKSKKNHEPAQTLMVDLDKPAEEILARMKPKTRYNIRLAEKKGVIVEETRSKEAITTFLNLTKITAKRDGITPHPDQYYQKMIETIPEKILKVYIAKYQNKAISAVMVSFFGSVATYLHGASANEHRNVMAPFALQWRAMQDAKKAGCSKYDLGGTRLSAKFKIQNSKLNNEEKNENNEKEYIPEEGSWQGITRFKQGFCPACQPVEFPGCWDIVLDEKKYKTYLVLQKLKALSRGIFK